MPVGKKAPPQQSNLSEMWGKKKVPKKESEDDGEKATGKAKKGKAPAASEEDEPMNEDVPAPGTSLPGSVRAIAGSRRRCSQACIQSLQLEVI